METPEKNDSKKDRIARAKRLSIFLDTILSSMEYSYDPIRGHHIYRARNDFVMTDEMHRILKGSMYPKEFINSHKKK